MIFCQQGHRLKTLSRKAVRNFFDLLNVGESYHELLYSEDRGNFPNNILKSLANTKVQGIPSISVESKF